MTASSLFAALTGAGLLLSSTAAFAESDPPQHLRPGAFSLRIETGAAIPLGAPQATTFGVGLSQTIKGMWALNRYFELGPSVTFTGLPKLGSTTALGTAWSVGPSLRFKSPHDLPDDSGLLGLSPWLDVDALYVRTGPLNRAGFSVAAGIAAPIGRARVFWLGPFVRYFDIIQPETPGFNNADAKILTVGLSLEVGTGVTRPVETTTVINTVVSAPTSTVTCSSECPDRDRDSIPDTIDRCPDRVGPMDNWGCPVYRRVAVREDRLELKEKLYFAWNEATLEAESFPVLDEVVLALNDNKNFSVQVEGHTSSEGTDDHNQTLSENRARAVLDYLATHGIARDRLTFKGFASSSPADTNTTLAGRENNRRVEFVVQFTIINDGSHK